MLLTYVSVFVICCARWSTAAFDLSWETDTDLTSFVTHPEFRSPRFDVTIYDAESITPGYWFVAPYTAIIRVPFPPRYYQPCQTGPHIFDANGELVYSGACQMKNQNACDFRAWNFNGSDILSMILYKDNQDISGRAIVMDNSYQVTDQVMSPSFEPQLNMHEFNLVDGGRSALYISHRSELVNTADLTQGVTERGYILNVGFREVDVRSGATVFEWWAYPHVDITESTAPVGGLQGPMPAGWNWFHGNSVDKNAEGDYLISARFTDTIYKVSGKTGKVIWRLGGKKSDFEQLGSFNFSRQHDAHWVEHDCVWGSKEIITFLDNAGDEFVNSSTVSSALRVELDLDKMMATVLQRWIRPDEDRSLLRGNFQRLPNGNWFAAWSDNSYISEYTPTGRLVMEAEFASTRMVTYRAYKMNFTGQPIEPPVIKAFVYGVDPESSTTVSYVSWNGATEVEHWHFYNSQGSSLGRARRQGFETKFSSKGAAPGVYAEAIGLDGSVLGTTETYVTDCPPELLAVDGSGSRNGKGDATDTMVSSDLQDNSVYIEKTEL